MDAEANIYQMDLKQQKNFNKRNEMIQYLQIAPSLLKLRLVVCLLIVFSICPTVSYAQDEKAQALSVNLNDTLNFNEETKGLFNKLAKILKFRENRNKKEKERIYKFILELIKDQNLNVDSNIGEITRLLDSINKPDRLKIDSVNVNVIKNKEIIEALKAVVIDSFKVALDSVVKDKMRSFFIKQNVVQDSVEASLKKLRSVNYSCKYLEQNKDSALSKTETLCLSPKKQVIGWHNFKSKAYKNYNYNYLSAINIYGYELAADGESKYPKDLKELAKNGGVIEFAKNKCTDVHLTIFNDNPWEVSKFLKNSVAQNKLMEELEILILKKDITGVNIFFDVIWEGDNKIFSEFVVELHKKFKRLEEDKKLKLVLNITIPAIYDGESIGKVGLYNFDKLNSCVDNYLVTTDKMTSLSNKWAQSPSPLFSDENSGFGTIQSTINFYSNAKIPLSKLIVSVSYLGISWPVSNFNGKVNRNNGFVPYDIQYDLIISDLRSKKDLKNNIKYGLDSIQAAAYINIRDTINYFEPRYTQIWYENSQSLNIKYKWILDNNLAGISIRNLGYDDGHTELWDAIGSKLIKVESWPKREDTNPRRKCSFKAFKDVDEIWEKYEDLRIKMDKPIADSLKISYSKSIREIYNKLQLKFNKKLFEDLKPNSPDSILAQQIDLILNRNINTKILKKGRWSKFYSIPIDNEKSIWYKFQRHDSVKDDESKTIKWIKNLIRGYELKSDYEWAAEPETYYVGAFAETNLENGGDLQDVETCLCLYKRLIIFSNMSFIVAGLCVLIIISLIFWINYLDRLNKGSKIKRNSIKSATLIFGIIAAVLISYGLYMTPYVPWFGASNQGNVSIWLLLILMFFGVLFGAYAYHRYSKGKYLAKNLP